MVLTPQEGDQLHVLSGGGVAAVQLASAYSVDVLLVPAAIVSGGSPAAWPRGRYRLTFVYHRQLGADPEDDRSDRPVEERLRSHAPERVNIEWPV